MVNMTAFTLSRKESFFHSVLETFSDCRDEYTDLEIRCADGLIAYAHRAHVSLFSPFLKSLFLQHEGMTVLILDRIPYRSVRHLLSLIYTGRIVSGLHYSEIARDITEAMTALGFQFQDLLDRFGPPYQESSLEEEEETTPATRCLECNRSFRSLSLLRRHLHRCQASASFIRLKPVSSREIHGIHTPSPLHRCFTCPLCPMSFIKQTHLREHLCGHYYKKIMELVRSKSASMNPREMCFLCRKRNVTHFTRHYGIVHGLIENVMEPPLFHKYFGNLVKKREKDKPVTVTLPTSSNEGERIVQPNLNSLLDLEEHPQYVERILDEEFKKKNTDPELPFTEVNMDSIDVGMFFEGDVNSLEFVLETSGGIPKKY